MASMFKVFTKTLEDGFFPVVMVDTINNKVEHFDKYWSLAKQKGFEVYHCIFENIGFFPPQESL